MMNSGMQEKIVNSGAAVSWFGWLISHIEQINGLLQTGVLLLSGAASVAAIWAARRRGK